MLPYIQIGSFALPTFGLMLWLAAVASALLLHLNFRRNGVKGDALTIVAITTVMGVLGAKLWHELEDPAALATTLKLFAHLLRTSPPAFFPQFFTWLQSGFAWFGGLTAAILTLLWMGRSAGIGPLRMLDLSAAPAALGYGIGRIGCHLSGDGDYGIATNVPWAVSYPRGLVPTTERVHPTPIYEFLFGMVLAAFLWWRGGKQQPLGRLTGEYLLLSGAARFLVEFIRRNPKVLWGLSNAQLASAGSMAVGAALILWSARSHATARNLQAAGN